MQVAFVLRKNFASAGKPVGFLFLHEGLVERHFLQTVADLFGIGATVESGDAKITFAFGAETAARGDDHLQFIQHPIEHLPTR